MPSGRAAEPKAECGGAAPVPALLPRLRSGYVLRDRLKLPRDRLPASIGVFAPASFGKTQLLAFWFYDLRARGFEAIWADGRHCPALADLHAGLASRRAGTHFAIFIDNADRAEAVEAIQGKLGSGDILILSGREPCSVPAEQVFLQNDLRLGSEEAGAFLRNRLGPLAPAIAAEVIEHCAGVPALLNIAIADLIHDPDGRGLSFRTGGGLIAAYVEDSIVAHLPAWQLAILRDIAVLDSFSMALAAHLAERDDCDAAIAQMMAGVPLFRSVSATEFALLPAFRTCLLAGGDPARIASRHCLAARWYQAQGMHGQAIHHAVAGEDSDYATALMDEHLLEIVTGGELERSLKWLATIPRDRLIQQPDLCLASALAYMIADEMEQAHWLMAHQSPDHRLILKAAYLSLKDRYDDILMLLKQVASVEGLSPVAAASYRNFVASAAARQGNQPPRIQEAASAEHLKATHAIGRLLEVERLLGIGCSEAAIRTIEPLLIECEARLGRSSSITVLAAVGLASALFQAGEFERADRLLADRIDEVAAQNLPIVVCGGLITAARLAAVRGDHELCLDHLERLEACGIDRDIPRLRAIAQAERVRLYVRARQPMLASVTLTALEATQKCVRAETPINSGRVDLEVLLARAHVLNALGRQDELVAVLDTGEALANALGRKMELAEADALRYSRGSAQLLDRHLKRLRIGEGDRRSLLARMWGGTPHALQPEQVRSFDILGRPALVKLTAREQHILTGLSRNLSNKTIARELDLSSETVKWYVGRILDKLGAKDRRQAVDRACAFGVLQLSYARAAQGIGEAAAQARAAGRRDLVQP